MPSLSDSAHRALPHSVPFLCGDRTFNVDPSTLDLPVNALPCGHGPEHEVAAGFGDRTDPLLCRRVAEAVQSVVKQRNGHDPSGLIAATWWTATHNVDAASFADLTGGAWNEESPATEFETVAETVDQFANLGVTNPQLMWAWLHLVTPTPAWGPVETVRRWHDVQVTNPDVASRWLAAGVDHRHVPAWRRLHVTSPAGMHPWLVVEGDPAAPVDGGTPFQWTAFTTDLRAIQAWRAVGVNPRHAERFAVHGATASVVRRWRENGVYRCAAILSWLDAGIRDPAVARRWIDGGAPTPQHVAWWQERGVGTESVCALQRWHQPAR